MLSQKTLTRVDVGDSGHATFIPRSSGDHSPSYNRLSSGMGFSRRCIMGSVDSVAPLC
jgi:hypothetical protein